MRLLPLILIISLLIFSTESSLYLYNTEDDQSVEFFDCIGYQTIRYCRRPTEPINLQRNQLNQVCYRHGKLHTFATLRSNNISVGTILHQWRSSIEKVEEYARYLRQTDRSIDDHNKTLCQCIDMQSFGKNCNYLLPIENDTFEATLNWQIHLRMFYPDYYQYSSPILCYTTLDCNSGRLCLDWRDICDGVQQCIFGNDEEVCDLLEFNECEDDEYRCMNGMCIPEDYFLDGDFDCMDLIDEKQQFNDIDCTYQAANLMCDDRICLPNQWSCGDGQCLKNRLAFQQLTLGPHECTSRRDQYYMCETSFVFKQWTLPNGKCDRSGEYVENNISSSNQLERCFYYFKCQLTLGFEKNCPCDDTKSCRVYVERLCPFILQYPAGLVITSYTGSRYLYPADQIMRKPHVFSFEALIKCRGFAIQRSSSIPYPNQFDLRHFEFHLCNYSTYSQMLYSAGYDRDCHQNSVTFNNRSYHFLDVCRHSGECLSAYRIKDGIRNCADGLDEELNEENRIETCSKYRFRCSSKELMCLSVNKLGDGQADCQNKHDEFWMGTSLPLSEMICNEQSQKDCAFLREYIEQSGRTDRDSVSTTQTTTRKLSFHRFCDTFYDLGSKEDEDLNMCHKWWICPVEQWQCHSGQCIDVQWVLDGEWDCRDASDEEALWAYHHALSAHNSRLINTSYLTNKFNNLYKSRPFSNICNLTKEYPCFRVDIAQPLINITHNRPCIDLQQIGDNHIDCIGAIDERNTLRHCVHPTTLGRDFLCVSTGTCINEFDLCRIQCPNLRDDHILCYYQSLFSGCPSEHHLLCLNQTCSRSGKCNDHIECMYGEDEYMCNRADKVLPGVFEVIYRFEKEQKMKKQIHQLHQNHLKTFNRSNLSVRNQLAPVNIPLPYQCNRGVGIITSRNLTACFCPPHYYGDQCQFHNDRLTVLLHVNFSQSIYANLLDQRVILKFLVLFLFRNQTLSTEEFHLRPALENVLYTKWFGHFLYSRSNRSIEYKRKRYFHRSNIINIHPYRIRIEAYEFLESKKAHLIAVWQYPVYFDYLPSFRISKILRLLKPTSNIPNPCSSNPCAPTQQCHLLENQRSAYICLCRDNYTGTNCSELDLRCQNNYCAPQALCQPTSRGVLSGDQRPYCLCPLNKFGDRCELESDICHVNPCENNGTCDPVPDDHPREFLCICDHFHHGKLCEQKKQGIQLHFNGSIEHRGATIQYFKLNLITFDLKLLFQRVVAAIPQALTDLLGEMTVADVIVLRIYLNEQIKIYLIVVPLNDIFINQTIHWYEQQSCMSVDTLNTRFAKRDSPSVGEITPIRYHHFCMNMSMSACFYDHDYLCMCTNHTIVRAACFGYDHYLDHCSRCLADARCLQADPLRKNDFICLCPSCSYGSVCQFNGATQSFSLDSLFVRINRNSQVFYLTLSIAILIIGAMNNYASFITFKRPNLYRLGVARYLLVSSWIGQLALVVLLGKTVQNMFPSLILNPITCKILSYLLSTFTRCSFWLISWVTLERLFIVLYPFSNLLKKPILSSTIIVITLCIVSLMHIHELIFYTPLEDSNGQLLCIARFPSSWSIYNRINLIAQYVIPVFIQFVGITILIVLTTRSRSRTQTKKRDTFVELLQKQFKDQKELYIVPVIIIISSLPQVVLSFIFSCTELLLWQRHSLLVAYLLSYAPQLLGFILFVSPSKNFSKEFRETSFGKRVFCQLFRQKPN